MEETPKLFNLKLSKIPLLNLRQEFAAYYQLLSQKEFRNQFHDNVVKPVQSPYLDWYGMPEGFLTLILQRAILGVESFLPGAVFIEAGMAGMLDDTNLHKIRNPFKLGGKTTADNFYHRLPALLDPALSLKVSVPELWEQNFQFYNEIRNPLFHGRQIDDRKNVYSVYKAFIHLASIYDWIDSWHSMEKIVSGASDLSAITTQKRS